jgi:hypothetical protein
MVVSEGDLNLVLAVRTVPQNSVFSQFRGGFQVVVIPARRTEFGPYLGILMTR